MKIGLVLLSLGGLFMLLGILLFFDGGLLTVANLLLLAAMPFLMGMRKTLRFFNPVERRERARGILCFFAGILLVVVVRWPLIGMVVEGVGIVDLFGTFLPQMLSYLRHLPVVGPLFASSPARWLSERLQPKPARAAV